jgi:hypothetical protein
MIRPTVPAWLAVPCSLMLGVVLCGLATPARVGAQSTAGAEPATVFGVGVAQAQGQLPSEFERRRALLATRPFVPLEVPPLPVEARTVFYAPRALEGPAIQVIVQPPEQVTAVPEGVVHVASWLVPEGDTGDRLGEVAGFAGEQVSRFGRTTVHLHDLVRLDFRVEGAARVGDELMMYRTGRTIEGVGDVLVPTGRVSVVSVDGGRAVASVVEGYERIQIGDWIGRVRTFSLEPGVHPFATTARAAARLVAFEERKEIHLPGDFAFIDLGTSSGIQVGDEFLALDGAASNGRPIARFQVVRTWEAGSTVRLVSLVSAGNLGPGLGLVLDRIMP